MLGGFSFFYIIKLVEYWKIYNLTKKIGKLWRSHKNTSAIVKHHKKGISKKDEHMKIM